jgi:hypothetical protein
MTYPLAARVVAIPNRLAAWASNAWTRTAFEPAAARRIAGLRYWDGRIS